MATLWYDRQGNPISVREAEPLLSDMNYKVVAKHHEGGYEVSTVWLGLNHNWGDLPLAIFETMIFGPESWDGEYCDRYPTETAALAGHDQAVMHLRDEILGAGA